MPNTLNAPLATDDLSPMYAGNIFPIWNPTFQDKFGVPLNLTGVSNNQITLRMQNEATGVAKSGAGVVQIVNAAGGVITYAWDPADTSTPGEWLLQFTINWNDISPQSSDLYALVIYPAL